MPSRSAEIDDVLSSIRKIIDERRPADGPQEAPAPQSAKPPALVLSRDDLVSLPVPAAGAAAVASTPETPLQQSEPAQGVGTPPADDNALFGPDPERWVHRPTAAPDVGRDADADARTGRAGPAVAPFATGPHAAQDMARRAERADGPSDAPSGLIPQHSLDRIAEAARKASARHAPLRPANADVPLRSVPLAEAGPKARQSYDASDDNMFSPLLAPVAVPSGPDPKDDADDKLAEHLADVVRDQIAESLPQQIKALAPHLLDEDILRPVVAEMIRKELSGPLGARITQGVRKLVRQELNRAITLRRLE